jgi:hypothetical protein
MNGQQLYALYERKNLEVMNCGVEAWAGLERDDQDVWNAMAEAIAVEFDPSADRAQLVERLESAECVIRQVSDDTFGERLSVKEFADRSGYDS